MGTTKSFLNFLPFLKSHPFFLDAEKSFNLSSKNGREKINANPKLKENKRVKLKGLGRPMNGIVVAPKKIANTKIRG